MYIHIYDMYIYIYMYVYLYVYVYSQLRGTSVDGNMILLSNLTNSTCFLNRDPNEQFSWTFCRHERD